MGRRGVQLIKKILKAKIEKVQYEFDEFDIRRAFIEMMKIKGEPNQTVDFDWDVIDTKLVAFLTITYKSEEETVQEKES